MSQATTTTTTTPQRLSNASPQPSACPVNDLPNELLAYIFQIGVDTSDANFFKAYNDFDLLELSEGWEVGEEVSGAMDSDSEGRDFGMDLEDSGSMDLEVPGAMGAEISGEDDIAASESSMESSESPFQVLVSLVCKRWQEVSYASPPLWTYISIDQSTNIELIQTWITRSKTSPLSINIRCQLPKDHSPEEGEYDFMNASTDLCTRAEQIARYPLQKNLLSRKEFSDFLDLLVPQIKRWKFFQVKATFYSYIYIILERLAKAPPADTLQELYLRHSGPRRFDQFHFRPPELKTAFTLFQASAPQLKKIALVGVHLDWEGSLPMLANLKELELTYHAMDVRPSPEIFTTMIATNSPHPLDLILSGSGPSEPPET